MHPSIPVFQSNRHPRRRHRGFSACLAIALLSFGLLSVGPAWSRPPAKSAASAKPSANAAPSASASPFLDSAQVHKLYLDGEFDAAIAILEGNLKETRQYGHNDSVFIFKHLGVMYTAQYETREKGKYYMHKLLSVEPSAKIMDMYASDMIYMIFKNIQEEYEQSRMYLSKQDRKDSRADSMAAAGSRSGTDGQRPEKTAHTQSGDGHKWAWTGATVAAIAAGVGVYYIFSADPQTTVKEKDTSF